MMKTNANFRNMAARLTRLAILSALLCAAMSVGAFAAGCESEPADDNPQDSPAGCGESASDYLNEENLKGIVEQNVVHSLNTMNGGKGFAGAKNYSVGRQYIVESTSAKYNGTEYKNAYYYPKDAAGGSWYYFEYLNSATFSGGGGDLWFAILFTDKQHHVHWTDGLEHANNSIRYCLDFGSHSPSQSGEVNAFFIKMPADCDRIVGIMVAKDADKPWAADWMRVAKAQGDPRDSAVLSAGDGRKCRSFAGEWVAVWTPQGGMGDMQNDLNFVRKYGAIFLLTGDGSGTTGGSSLRTNYLFEVVTGEKGYEDATGYITLNYTDQMGVTWNHTESFFEAYERANPDRGLDDVDADSNVAFMSWDSMNTLNMQAAAAALTHNLYSDWANYTAFLPYTATHLMIQIPDNIKKINSVTLTLNDTSSSPVIQSIRMLEYQNGASSLGAEYWNGSYSRERLRIFDGRILAESTRSYTISSGSLTLDAASTTSYQKLQTYEKGRGPTLSTRSSMVGVSIQFADLYNAGVDELMAHNGSGDNFWTNLDPYVEECFTLELTYKDTRGAQRRVKVPVLTTYICQIVMQDAICKTGLHASNLWGSTTTGAQLISSLNEKNPKKEWISGLLRQDDNVGLSLRLSEFGELVSLRFTYGVKPDGFTYTTTSHTEKSGCSTTSYTTDDVRRIDTDSDVIAIENVCFYTGLSESNFKNSYDAAGLGVKFETTLTPKYSYTAASKNGVRFAKNGALNLEAGKGSFTAGKPASTRDYSKSYLVRIATPDIDNAGTTDPVRVSVGYTRNDGSTQNLPAVDMVRAAANYYGISSLGAAEHEQYEMHMQMGGTIEFLLELSDVKSIDSVTLTLTGKDEWQVKSIEISKLDSLGARTASGGGRYGNGRILWTRNTTATRLAYAQKTVLLYENNATRTINFSAFNEKGEPIHTEETTKNESYIHTLPEELSYNDALKDLGLAVPKYTYMVSVTVADVPDAGSSNYFYFQLSFENGMSGVVLANQQLASDSFRQGMTETFQIKTTQNYGKLLSVRIICDNATSTSNVFDKLNIDHITVSLSGSSGVSRSWIVERVGWIDITYSDEGANEIINEFGSDAADGREKNIEIVKDFEITKVATAVDLLFAVSTAKPGKAGAVAPAMNATLVYNDSYGAEQTLEFNMTDQIKAYNDTENTAWLYRGNHFDRFVLSLTDVSSIQALYLTQGAQNKTPLSIATVSIQQIGGLGEVYLSDALGATGEYYRDPVNPVDLAVSTNEEPIAFSGEQISITFTENEISVNREEEEATRWNTAISSVPNTRNDMLNVYIFPGKALGKDTVFAANYPGVRATVNYSTVYGGRAVSSAFDITKRTTLSDGTTVLCGSKLAVNGLATLNSIKLSSMSKDGGQPYIGRMIVERVRDGVMLETYCLDYGGFYLGNGNPEASPQINTQVSPMHQTVQLQVAPDQAAALTAGENDILVALRYTSALDESGATVYRSPYVYLTGAGITSLSYGKAVTVPFSVGNVGRVVGLSIIGTGANVGFERALIANYGGAAGDDSVLLGSCGVQQSFVSSTMRTDAVSDGSTVVPATFTFVTGAEESYSGAGSQGRVDMSVECVNASGSAHTVKITDIAKYLPTGEAFEAGSTRTVRLLLPDTDYIKAISLSAEDDWFLSSVTATVTPPGGVPASVTKSVNNHAGKDKTLTVDVTPTGKGGSAEGNDIVSFTVTGSASGAGTTASATSTSATGMRELQISAYAGDTVTITPSISAVGSPDTTWTWFGANDLNVSADNGSATFTVPAGTAANSKFDVGSVRCNGDRRLTIGVTVNVIPVPEPPQQSGGSAETGGGSSSSTNPSGNTDTSGNTDGDTSGG